MMSRPFLLFLFVFLTWTGGAVLGFLMDTSGWYQALSRPSFTPPDWVFAPVWSALYIMIGIAGARTWQANPRGLAMKLWFLQLFLNYAWTPVFFGLHSIGLALVVILLLLISIGGFIGATRRKDAISTWLFVPYLLWVLYASALNVGFLMNNP